MIDNSLSDSSLRFGAQSLVYISYSLILAIVGETLVETYQSSSSPLPVPCQPPVLQDCPVLWEYSKPASKTSKDAHGVHTNSASAPPESDRLFHLPTFLIQILCLKVRVYCTNITFCHLEFETKPSLLEYRLGGFVFFWSQKKPFFKKITCSWYFTCCCFYRYILLIDGNQTCYAASCSEFETTEALCLSVGSHWVQYSLG